MTCDKRSKNKSSKTKSPAPRIAEPGISFKKTLPILIAQLRSADFLKFDMGKVYMMVAIAILPVIIVYLLLSKFIARERCFRFPHERPNEHSPYRRTNDSCSTSPISL